MRAIWLVPVIASILFLGSLGLSQQAFALQFIVNNQATCEGAPIFGTFDSGTCVLSGTHTIPLSPGTTWQFEIVSKVTGTVDVFGELQFRADHSNFGTINVIGDPGGAGNRGLMVFVFGSDYTNECSGIINLIGGNIGFRSGTLRVIGQDEFEPIFNNFGTINGIDSDLGEEIATVQLVSAPSIPVFNNHGTLTAPVQNNGGTFNDNLPNQCSQTPEEQTQNVIDELGDINPPKADDAIAKLDTAKDELAKDPPDHQAAAGNIEGAIGEIEAAIELVPVGEQPALIALMDDLAGIARQLATDAIELAEENSDHDADKIITANAKLAEGDVLRDPDMKFKDAASKYKDALSEAQSALP